jgi:hypothetical protein
MQSLLLRYNKYDKAHISTTTWVAIIFIHVGLHNIGMDHIWLVMPHLCKYTYAFVIITIHAHKHI